MKNRRLFLGLAAVVIHSICGACEDANFFESLENTVSADSNVKVVIFEKTPQDDATRDRFTDLFSECYKNNNVQACQEIIAFTEKKALIDKLILLNQLNDKQCTINIQRETIEIFNELNRRKNERNNKKKEARERELSNKLNNEN